MARVLFLSFLLASLFVYSFAEARERDRPFRRGWGGFRGNERSERPGRVGVGEVRYRGNGCPDGTMRIVMAPDNLSFSVLFDKFVAETAPGVRPARDIMTCDATVGFEVPAGMQMAITRVDYRGFAGIPEGGRGALVSTLNFLDRNQRDRDRMHLRYQFFGPVMENYEISTGSENGENSASSERSACGGIARLRIKNELRLQARRATENASVTLDSIDGAQNAVYFVSWHRCDEGRNQFR